MLRNLGNILLLSSSIFAMTDSCRVICDGGNISPTQPPMPNTGGGMVCNCSAPGRKGGYTPVGPFGGNVVQPTDPAGPHPMYPVGPTPQGPVAPPTPQYVPITPPQYAPVPPAPYYYNPPAPIVSSKPPTTQLSTKCNIATVEQCEEVPVIVPGESETITPQPPITPQYVVPPTPQLPPQHYVPQPTGPVNPAPPQQYVPQPIVPVNPMTPQPTSPMPVPSYPYFSSPSTYYEQSSTVEPQMTRPECICQPQTYGRQYVPFGGMTKQQNVNCMDQLNKDLQNCVASSSSPMVTNIMGVETPVSQKPQPPAELVAQFSTQGACAC
ncbi:hypothetical protein SLOPH_675 [Spraguea lophii 42_110]|uniref:Uncharacterized protein n=1 Tax=Spraguea lophii (strain 42_110) TaxID=1358809 RepID=S7W9W7_SPRLO|nr:hypothetical protein SLOPH_675 [Spraguea lophii 42_110]